MQMEVAGVESATGCKSLIADYSSVIITIEARENYGINYKFALVHYSPT